MDKTGIARHRTRDRVSTERSRLNHIVLVASIASAATPMKVSRSVLSLKIGLVLVLCRGPKDRYNLHASTRLGIERDEISGCGSGSAAVRRGEIRTDSRSEPTMRRNMLHSSWSATSIIYRVLSFTASTMNGHRHRTPR